MLTVSELLLIRTFRKGRESFYIVRLEYLDKNGITFCKEFGINTVQPEFYMYKVHMPIYFSVSKKRLKLDLLRFPVLKYWASMLDRQNDTAIIIKYFNREFGFSDQLCQ